jgi:hypothetical protein
MMGKRSKWNDQEVRPSVLEIHGIPPDLESEGTRQNCITARCKRVKDECTCRVHGHISVTVSALKPDGAVAEWSGVRGPDQAPLDARQGCRGHGWVQFCRWDGPR